VAAAQSLLTSGPIAGFGHPEKEKSPFAAVRWQGSQPEVRVGDEWFKLASLDGIPASEIVAFSRRNFGSEQSERSPTLRSDAETRGRGTRHFLLDGRQRARLGIVRHGAAMPGCRASLAFLVQSRRAGLCLTSSLGPKLRLGPQLREARLRLDDTSKRLPHAKRSPPKAEACPSRVGA
jgi:hypothetical protein